MNFVGIDPGFTGGIALISDAGLTVWEIPIHWVGEKQYKSLDLPLIKQIFQALPQPVKIVLENPTTRPKEGAEQCFRFGKGIGCLEGLMVGLGIDYTLISPMAWMGGIGVPGKDHDIGCQQRIEYVRRFYADADYLWLGPRGGLKDGIVEACCMALYLKQITESPVGRMGGKKKPPKFRGRPPE
jgi:crossover junction endodeoxyribonuclease RuvC